MEDPDLRNTTQPTVSFALMSFELLMFSPGISMNITGEVASGISSALRLGLDWNVTFPFAVGFFRIDSNPSCHLQPGLSVILSLCLIQHAS
jgi:hypothetical protein